MAQALGLSLNDLLVLVGVVTPPLSYLAGKLNAAEKRIGTYVTEVQLLNAKLQAYESSLSLCADVNACAIAKRALEQEAVQRSSLNGTENT